MLVVAQLDRCPPPNRGVSLCCATTLDHGGRNIWGSAGVPPVTHGALPAWQRAGLHRNKPLLKRQLLDSGAACCCLFVCLLGGPEGPCQHVNVVSVPIFPDGNFFYMKGPFLPTFDSEQHGFDSFIFYKDKLDLSYNVMINEPTLILWSSVNCSNATRRKTDIKSRDETCRGQRSREAFLPADGSLGWRRSKGGWYECLRPLLHAPSVLHWGSLLEEPTIPC